MKNLFFNLMSLYVLMTSLDINCAADVAVEEEGIEVPFDVASRAAKEVEIRDRKKAAVSTAEQDKLDEELNKFYQEANRAETEQVRKLIKEGANVNRLTFFHNPIIFHAISNNNRELLNELLDAGANIEAVATISQTPLAVAVEKGNKDMVELLLNKGANTNVPAGPLGNLTLLAVAAQHGFKDIIRLLLAKKLDVNEIRTAGRSALGLAALNADLDTVKLLVDAGANVKDNTDALVSAAITGKKDIVEFLLAQGADVEKPYYGQTIADFVRNEADTIEKRIKTLDYNTRSYEEEEQVKEIEKQKADDIALKSRIDEIIKLIEAEPARRAALRATIKKEAGAHLPPVLTDIVADYAVAR